MIELKIDKSRTGLHNNLIFRIPEAKVNGRFDLYYFAIDYDKKPLKNPLVGLIEYWINNSIGLNVNEFGYLPIDLSDEYTGCLRIGRIAEDKLELKYGLSRIEGWAINPSNPGKFFNSVEDFEFDDDTIPVTVDRTSFLDNLNDILEKLKNNLA